MASFTLSLTLAFCACSTASRIRQQPKCTKVHKDWISSRPGVPCLGDAATYPFKNKTAWRGKLGDRIVAAVTPRVTEKDCGGVTCFGDSTWCNKAMGAKNVVGLSYGIEERDLWSEKMASNWMVPTRLFDCYQDPKSSPAISGKAPNGTSCKPNGPQCYAAPYHASQTCLASVKETIDGRAFDTLHAELAGRAPLSVHLKMDVEGSEWATLEDLVKNEHDVATIRSLDMEVHFGFNPSSEKRYQHLSEQELIERQTEILERVSKKFAAVGSTLEQIHQSWHPEEECRHQQCNEPAVHLPGGLAVTQLCVSFVGRAIV